MEHETHTTPVTEMRLVMTVDDHDAALRLYRDVLGLAQVEHDEQRGGQVTILDAGRATLELNDAAYATFIDEVEVGRRIEEPLRVAFRVADAAAATGLLEAGGATVLAPPTRTPWGSRNARLRDPHGLQLTLFEEPGDP